ncbi:Lipopolysaccharide export system permease protein LptG [hydrothermal vent metagenome]|uniref:Lipopolysaccharide export system permease protein LptG n=1 Tax=hydrothermal vent metagenome TaxID=652676 RepID=A0A3B0WTC2_9ZZZZ
MRILDRYIAKTVISGTLMVLMVLGALLAFVDFVSELDDVGRGQYSIAQAGIYVALRLPKRLYELFPTAVLIGSLLSLGALAGNSELTVMRAAGVSIMRITFSVLKAGFILLICAAVVGEWGVPWSEHKAQTLRAKGLMKNISLGSGGGFWARDDGRFLYVSKVYPDRRLGEISVYELSDNNQLQRITHAESAIYVAEKWHLNQVKQTDFSGSQVQGSEMKSVVWEKLLNPDLFNVVSIKPENMSAIDLYHYTRYMKSNQLDSSSYELAFWIKVFTPVSSLVMLLIAMPFVFGSQRTGGAGNRMLAGLLLGIGFYLLNRTVNHIGQVYHFYPLLSAGAPLVVIAAGSIYALRRIK